MPSRFLGVIATVVTIVAALCAFVIFGAVILWPAGKESAQTSPPTSDAPQSNSNSQTDPPASAGRQTIGGLLLAATAAYEQKDAATLQAVKDQLAVRSAPQAERHLLDAMQLALNNQFTPALEILFAIAKQPSTKPQALALAGELLFRQQDFQTAQGVLKAAIVADSSNPNPHRWLAAYYYDVGAMDDALYHLSEIAKLAPEDARSWRMRGIILQDFERHAEAIEAYKTALEKNLSERAASEVHAELGKSLLAARNPQEAKEHLSLADETAATFSLRADCELALGDMPAAKSNLAKALELEPNHAQALMIKATLAREQGDNDLAIETLSFAVEQHPYEYDFRFQLMSALNAAKRPEEAKIQAEAMKRLRDLRDKFTQLHHESMADPSSAELRFQLGQTAEELGKIGMAFSWYRAALAIDPTFSKARAAIELLTKRSTAEQ